MKNLKPIVIIQSIIIVGLLLFLFKDKLFSFEEKRIKSEYEKIKGKSVIQMTESEWKIRNKYKLLEAKEKDTLPDTLSYETAIYQARYNAALKELNNPCTETKLIEAFHQIMEFNMPNDRYDKNKITVARFDDCTIRISLTTREPKYGWKTFWVLEIKYNAETNNYHMNIIKSDFLG